MPGNDETSGGDGRQLVDHTYRDFSQYISSGGELIKHKKSDANFPAKLQVLLSDEKNADVITWMPHGRAWKILDKKQLVSSVLPEFFGQTKFESFTRQLNGWGFSRLYKQGPDNGCYYHECFLRGLPKLTVLMRRSLNKGKFMPYPEGEPDLYSISAVYPLPSFAPSPNISSSSMLNGHRSSSRNMESSSMSSGHRSSTHSRPPIVPSSHQSSSSSMLSDDQGSTQNNGIKHSSSASEVSVLDPNGLSTQRDEERPPHYPGSYWYANCSHPPGHQHHPYAAPTDYQPYYYSRAIPSSSNGENQSVPSAQNYGTPFAPYSGPPVEEGTIPAGYESYNTAAYMDHHHAPHSYMQSYSHYPTHPHQPDSHHAQRVTNVSTDHSDQAQALTDEVGESFDDAPIRNYHDPPTFALCSVNFGGDEEIEPSPLRRSSKCQGSN